MPLVTLPDGQVFDSEDFRACKIEEFYGGHWYVYVELKNSKRLPLSASSEEDAQKKAKQIRNRITRSRRSRSAAKQLEQGEHKAGVTGITIFIGHGNSPVWRELRDFLEKRLHLSVEEFNSVSVAGVPTVTRLEEMLNAAAFAFLVMSAEDELPGGKGQAVFPRSRTASTASRAATPASP
jgi:predicted nucleotide-binding protein